MKQIAAAAIPNVIRYGEQIGFVENWKGRGYNTHTFVAPVVVDGIKIYEAVIVNEYTVPNAASKFYVHEVCGSDGSLLTIENGKITKKESSLTTVLKTEQGDEAPKLLSKNSIAQENAESKGNSEPVKKSVRFQLSAPVEVDKNKDLVAVHNLTAENLQEALELGGMPSPSIAVVKAQEGHTKYGPISLVFNSDTIDPMVNRANRIYGSDAWTPTRPNVEFEVNYDAMRDFESKVDSASKMRLKENLRTALRYSALELKRRAAPTGQSLPSAWRKTRQCSWPIWKRKVRLWSRRIRQNGTSSTAWAMIPWKR